MQNLHMNRMFNYSGNFNCRLSRHILHHATFLFRQQCLKNSKMSHLDLKTFPAWQTKAAVCYATKILGKDSRTLNDPILKNT